MKMLNRLKKGQSLPLNTIVIAILVVIVLLIIIVFFTGGIGGENDKINDLKACSDENSAINSMGYTNVDWSNTINQGEEVKCSGGKERISIIPSKKVDGGTKICCGDKGTNTEITS